ncbi:MAG: hypothetical protein IPI95_12265 [Flavobacteriales bacterium]|nr:hypothetical protein [Flavobacteriales bacterium]
MNRALTIAFGFLFANSLCAQGIYGRKRPEIFPTDGKMRRGGFYFAPGITYTLTRFKDKEETVFSNGDTSYTALFDPNGKDRALLRSRLVRLHARSDHSRLLGFRAGLQAAQRHRGFHRHLDPR